MHIKMINGLLETHTFQVRSFESSFSFDGESTEEGPYGPMWIPGNMCVEIEIVANSYPQCIRDLVNDSFSNAEERVNTNISLELIQDTTIIESANGCILVGAVCDQPNQYEINTHLSFISWNTSLNRQPSKKSTPVKPMKINWRKEGF